VLLIVEPYLYMNESG